MESNCPVRAREVPAAPTLPWPVDTALWPAVDDVELEPDDADGVEPEADADDVAPEADDADDGGFPTVSAALICAFCDEPPKPPLPKAVPPALGPVLDCEGLYAAKSF
jgi:hypothetical protein